MNLLEKTRSFLELPRYLLFLQVETLPYRREILRCDSLALRWIPASEWVFGIRSLFLFILLNHLPQEKQILYLMVLSGLLSHSVFWDIFLTYPNFLVLHIGNLNIFLPNSRMSPFQIHSAIKAYPVTTPGNTFFPNWWILTLSLVKMDDIQPLLLKVLPALWMILQVVFHMAFSRLPTGLGHFTDSKSIPYNPPNIYHPVRIAIIQLMFPLLLVV